MAEDRLFDRLAYAVLEIVMWDPAEAVHQDHWGAWASAVRNRVPTSSTQDLLSTFKLLAKHKILRLTKPNQQRLHAEEYSGDEADDERFFFKGPFNASITDEGRAHWDAIRAPASKRTIGFVP